MGHYKVEKLIPKIVSGFFWRGISTLQHKNIFITARRNKEKKEAVIEQKINSAMETYEKN